MLVNDSVTITAEVPVFLTKNDIGYYRSRGFDLDFESDVITGHCDFLQIRNGFLHVLDYKPAALCAGACPTQPPAAEKHQMRLV